MKVTGEGIACDSSSAELSLDGLATPEAKKVYPPIHTGDQVRNELEAISLAKSA